MSDSDGRKARFMVTQWAELRKSGGLSFNDAEIEQILKGGEQEVFTRQQLIDRCAGYFKSCLSHSVDDENGEIIATWKRNPTKAGLALALGITTQTLSDYVRGKNSVGNPYSSDNPDYKRICATEDFDVLRKAFLIIEDFYESKLGENRNNSGSIFWLLNSSNSRWSNNQEFSFGMSEPEEKTVRTSAQLLADMKRLTQGSTLPRLTEDGE